MEEPDQDRTKARAQMRVGLMTCFSSASPDSEIRSQKRAFLSFDRAKISFGGNCG